MGNTQSAKTSKKKTLEEIVDYIASNYILTQNFKDMENLANMSYCNKLVILTSKIIEKNLTNLEIEFMTQRMQKGKEINEMAKDKLMFFQQDNLVNLDVTNKTQKRRMCIGLAKFYVKIAQVFAAIVTTINPTYIFKVENTNSDTFTSPQKDEGVAPSIKTEGETEGDAPSIKTEGETEGVAPSIKTEGDAPSIKIEGDAPSIKIEGDAPIKIGGNDELKEVDLTQKHKLPENAKANTERINICSQRINALLNGEDYNVDVNKQVKVNPKFCDINNDKNKSKPKTLFSEPGIPELEKLYFDKYDYDNGGFIGMTKDMREKVYEKDVETFYKVFTGNDKMPEGTNNTPIKKFSQIELHDYKKLEGCNTDGLYTKPYTGTLKDKLIAKYAQHINLMMNKANKNQEKLFEYIDKLFSFNLNDQTKEKDIIINPNLTEKKLQIIVEDVRKIIFGLYKDCELDFSEGLKIFELMVEKTIKDTMVQQITNLEKDRDEVLAGSDLSEQTNLLPKPAALMPKPLITVPEPLITVPEPLMPMPEPLMPMPEPLVTVPEPLVTVPVPEPLVTVTVPEPLVTVTEPQMIMTMPEPLVSVPEPLVSVPEPQVSVTEPLVSVPEPAVCMPPKSDVTAPKSIVNEPEPDIFSKPMIKIP